MSCGVPQNLRLNTFRCPTDKCRLALTEMTTTRSHPVTTHTQDEQLAELQSASEAGEFDQSTADMIDYLLSQLPDGYAFDDHSRLVRLDPSLPDHIYIPARICGVPSDPVRVPVYR